MSPRRRETDRMPAALHRAALTMQFTCEVCDEELLVAVPADRTRYGAADCPCCGSSYLFLLEGDAGATPLPSVGVA